MEKARYWITAIGGDIGSAIARCVRAEIPKVYILGTDIKPYVQGLDVIDEMIVVPRASEECYLERAIAICKEKEITCIVPAHDSEITFYAHHKAIFEDMGIVILVHSPEFLGICQSKYKTAKWLESLGVTVPETHYYDQAPGDMVYPAIAKPDCGCGSDGIFLVGTKEELEAKQVTTPYVLQQYIGEKEEEYTLAVFHTNGQSGYVCMKRQLGYGGMSILIETVDFPWLDELVEKICSTNQFEGCINVQFRLQDGIPYIFEINPRISSTVRFRYLMGFKDAFWWMQYKLGHEVTITKVAPGKIGVKTTGEMILDK